MEIQWVEIEKIKPNPKNPNKHSEEQIKRLAEIIKYQGWRHPLIVDKDYMLWAGHGRLLAAKELGEQKVPIHVQEFQNDEQAYAFLVSDNAIASWAELDLADINGEIPALGPDFNIDLLGIKDFTLDVSEKGLIDDDEVPEPPKEAITKTGDLWILGNHRLLCGDCTVKENVERLMNGEKADMVFTSPPYNLGVSAKLRGNTQTAKQGNAYKEYNDNKSESEWLSLVTAAALLVLEHSRYAFINLQFLAGNRVVLPAFWYFLRDKIVDVMIWDKGHAQPAAGERVLNSRFEFVFIFTSDESPCRSIRIAPQFRGTIDNVYLGNTQRKNEFSEIHGATFPVEFPETYIRNFCPIDGSVIEPFSGSGSTLIACEKTNRRCFGMEIDPLYCDVIVERWEKYTGKKAQLGG